MKTAKRVLVVLAVVALLVGALGLTAFAADTSTKTTTNSDGSVTTTYNFTSVASTTYAAYDYDNGWKLSWGNGSQKASNATLLTYDTNKNVSTLTSPTLTGGISNLTFTYWYPFSESAANIQFTVKILDGSGAVLASQQISTSRGVSSGTSSTKYTFNSDDYATIKNALANIGESDAFKIQIYNNGTSVAKSKSRLAIGPLSWTNLAPVVEGDMTDEDKVDGALESIAVNEEIVANSTQDLVTEIAIFDGVSISWASDNALAVVSGNKVTYTLPEAGEDDVVVNLTATATCGDITKTKIFQVTLVAPMTEEEIVDAAFALASGATLAGGEYTLTGVVTSIKGYNATYSDVNLYMNVTGSNGTVKNIYCYGLKGTGNDAVQVGDTITVKGSIKNYNGTVEFDKPQLVEYPTPVVTVNGASLNIKDNIDVYYYVTAKAGFKSASASFTFNGATTTVSSYEKLEDGRIMFVFEGITPAQLGDEISVTFSVKYQFNTYTATNNGMSVKKYYQMAQNYEGTKNDTALMTLLSDLLVYGAAAQTYVGDTDALVTEGLTLTPSTNAIPESVFATTGDAFKSVALELGSDITVVIGVELEGGDVVIVNFNGITTTYAQEDLVADENGIYTIKFANVYATDYAEVITAEVNGNTLTYSVNSYINEKANDENANLAALVAALNNYGVSAAAYKNA